jgi:sortase (surface protein transpeptidase)
VKVPLIALLASGLVAFGVARTAAPSVPSSVPTIASEANAPDYGAPDLSSTVSTLAVSSGDDAVSADASPTPARVVIPALGLDVDIVSAGVDAEGRFDVPGADQVGWYQYGSAPGDTGSAVLAAHVDFGGRPGAFFELRTLIAGDLINVEFDDGQTRSFEVSDQVLYEKSALPADEIFRRDGPATLHLATCGGTFDEASHSYVGNRVVTALPID